MTSNMAMISCDISILFRNLSIHNKSEQQLLRHELNHCSLRYFFSVFIRSLFQNGLEKTLSTTLRERTKILLLGQNVTFMSESDNFSLNVSQETVNSSLRAQISGPRYQLKIYQDVRGGISKGKRNLIISMIN